MQSGSSLLILVTVERKKMSVQEGKTSLAMARCHCFGAAKKSKICREALSEKHQFGLG